MNPSSCVFDHIEVYSRNLHPLSYYKSLESAVKELSTSSGLLVDPKLGITEKSKKVPELRKLWKAIIPKYEIEDIEPDTYTQQNQDLVEQLIIGLGFRVTGYQTYKDITSVVVKAKKDNGATFIISSISKESNEAESSFCSKVKINNYLTNQNKRYGIGVLTFNLLDKKEEFGSNISKVYSNYKEKHSSLIATELKTTHFSNGLKLRHFEAFSYYDKSGTSPNQGTRLRFVEREDGKTPKESILPGLTRIETEYDSTSLDLIYDHWVSNVINRESFLKTLNDVLGFTPKVDFNAGVVAAGKAKIESTVTGNTLDINLEVEENSNPQVYLPINNALSEFGHVHLFLKEIGQGVQHIASRVDNLVNLMERVNCYRMITGRGFKSLRIPRVYYGALDKNRHLLPIMKKTYPENKIITKVVDDLFQFLIDRNIISVTGIVDLDLSREVLNKHISEFTTDSIKTNENLVLEVVSTVLKARYINIYNLAGDAFSEQSYLSIVRNKILVDKQGHDFLLQIFTSNILQDNIGEEAPFLEFIQRKCRDFETCEIDGKKCKITKVPKPGCGGFGIRNFLTLFLSIEVSKAMDDLQILSEFENNDKNEEKVQDVANKKQIAEEKIALYTKQLYESNPILNDLSEIMTAEAEVLEKINVLTKSTTSSSNENSNINELQVKAKELNNKKTDANLRLQALSERFVSLFDGMGK